MPKDQKTKRQHAAAAEVVDSAEQGAAGPQSKEPIEGTSRSFTSINIASYPHIIQRIIGYSSLSTRATLLRCSKDLFRTGVGSLYRNLRLKHDRFVNLIRAGLITPEASADPPALSPSMLEALQHIKRLHLKAYNPTLVIPALPKNALKALLTVVIYPLDDDVLEPTDDQPFAMINIAGLAALEMPQLIVRMEVGEIDSYLYRLSQLPTATRNVSFIVPFASYLTSIPVLVLDNADISRSVPLTIVMLPADGEMAHDEEGCEDWCQFFYSHGYFPAVLLQSASLHPVTLVGSEYLAGEPGYTASPQEALREAAAEYRTRRRKLSRVTFARWIEKQKPGVIFRKKELEDMKELDQCTMDAYGDRGYVF